MINFITPFAINSCAINFMIHQVSTNVTSAKINGCAIRMSAMIGNFAHAQNKSSTHLRR